MTAVWELAGLFVSAFTSATLLPGSSEAVLAGILAFGTASLWSAVMVATLGNTLGSLVNWGMGLFAAQFRHHRRFPLTPERYEHYSAIYAKMGRVEPLAFVDAGDWRSAHCRRGCDADAVVDRSAAGWCSPRARVTSPSQASCRCSDPSQLQHRRHRRVIGGALPAARLAQDLHGAADRGEIRREPDVIKPPALVGSVPVRRAIAPPAVDLLGLGAQVTHGIHQSGLLAQTLQRAGLQRRVADNIEELFVAPDIVLQRRDV